MWESEAMAMARTLGVPKVIPQDTQCWFGKWSTEDPNRPRCTRHGNWGWTKEAADKAGASEGSILRLSRWCPAHKHYDDTKLEEPCEKTYPGSPVAAPADPNIPSGMEPTPE